MQLQYFLLTFSLNFLLFLMRIILFLKQHGISVSDTFLCRMTNCCQENPIPCLKTDVFKLLITDIGHVRNLLFIHNIWVIFAQEAISFHHSYSTHAPLPSDVHGEMSSLWALSGLLLKGSAKMQSAEKIFV